MYAFITMPTIETLLGTSTNSYASGLFTELLPYALAVTGLIIGALFVRFIVLGGLKGGVMKLIGGKRKGRGRRGR